MEPERLSGKGFVEHMGFKSREKGRGSEGVINGKKKEDICKLKLTDPSSLS